MAASMKAIGMLFEIRLSHDPALELQYLLNIFRAMDFFFKSKPEKNIGSKRKTLFLLKFVDAKKPRQSGADGVENG